jgi:hypothetical protein
MDFLQGRAEKSPGFFAEETDWNRHWQHLGPQYLDHLYNEQVMCLTIFRRLQMVITLLQLSQHLICLLKRKANQTICEGASKVP